MSQLNHSALRQKGPSTPFFHHFFYSGPQWIEWCLLIWGGLSTLLSSPIQMLILFRNTITDTSRIMFSQISRYSMMQLI